MTGKISDLRGIVVFGSYCSGYREPRKNSLQQRSQRGVIVGISDETKGYKVRKENKVIVSQYVGSIETLLDAQNAQLQCEMGAGDRYYDTEDPESAAEIRDGNGEAKKDRSAR